MCFVDHHDGLSRERWMKNRKVEVTVQRGEKKKRFPLGAVFALMYSSGEKTPPQPTHTHTQTWLE